MRAFYHSAIDAMEGKPYHPMWQKDIYPAPEALRTAIDEQTMYLGLLEDRIAAAMVINQKCNEEYALVKWPQQLRPDEFMVIHMLCVHRDYAGCGYARQLVKYAIETAQKNHMKALRLDVLTGNLPAEKLYEGMGFKYVDTIKLFYEDTGRVDFKMYEYGITGQN